MSCGCWPWQARTTDPKRQAAVFFLLEQMAEYSQELKDNAAGLLSVFQTALSDAMAAGVRLAAVKALLSLVINLQAQDGLQGGNTKQGEAIAHLKILAPAVVAAVALPLQAKVRKGKGSPLTTVSCCSRS